MTTSQAILSELENAVRGGSPENRFQTLRRVTDLFLIGPERYSEEQVAVFDHVLSILVTEVESRACAELAERIGPIPNAPRHLIKRLASHDEIAVAAPILSQSSRLDDHDLVEIARSKSQGHMHAISNRAQIGEVVTDVLIERGNSEILNNVVGNPGARISEQGFGRLNERARDDEQLQVRLGLRGDIPPHQLRLLIEQATETVRARLAEAIAPSETGILLDVLHHVGGVMIAEAGVPALDLQPAIDAIEAMRATRRLDEKVLREFCDSGQLAETIVTLAAMTGTSPALVERLVTDQRTDPVLVLSKAARLGWPLVAALLRLCGGVRRLAPADLDKAAESFHRLSDETARRALGFYQAHDETAGPNSARKSG